MNAPDQAAAKPGAGAAVALGWLMTIALNLVAPLLSYNLLKDRGLATAPALALSGLGPLLEIAITAVRHRRIDEISMMVLIFLALGIVASVLFNSPRLLLAKDGLFGLVLLGSLLAPRPLMFYFGRRFATNGTAERIVWWNGLWQYASFRRGQRRLTAVWGTAYLTEAIMLIALSYQLTVSTMVTLNNIASYAVLAVLLLGTVTYGKRAGRAHHGREPHAPATRPA
jgi:hypothetical protein